MSNPAHDKLTSSFVAAVRSFLKGKVPAGVDSEEIEDEILRRLRDGLPNRSDAAALAPWIVEVIAGTLDDFRRSARARGN